MIVMVIDATEEVVTPEGMRLACVSTAGLPRGRLRLTFLPEGLFVDPAPDCDAGNGLPREVGPPRTNQRARTIDEWIKDRCDNT